MDVILHAARSPRVGVWAAVTRTLVGLVALAATSATAAPGTAGPEPAVPEVLRTQRWILTPAQRAAVERARLASGGAADDVAIGHSGPWKLQGLAQPQQTPGSAWVNGQLVRSGDTLDERVRIRAVHPDRVILEFDNRPMALRPGQTLQPDGQVSDLLSPRSDAPAAAAPMSKGLTTTPRANQGQ